MDALNIAKQRQVPVMILGGGSNVIFPDTGFPGLVVRMISSGWSIQSESANSVEVQVQAGQSWDQFVEFTANQNWFGIECLSGIPGTVAGVPVQNVGAYGQEGKDTIVSVRCLDRATHRIVEISGLDCAFEYRTSRFKHADSGKFIILDVTFRLNKTPGPVRYPELSRTLESLERIQEKPEALQRRMAVLSLRKSKSMVVDPEDPDSVSCGSFFTNPILSGEQVISFQAICDVKGLKSPVYPTDAGTKLSAAWLVENSGFKRGLTENGAGVSNKHALALVNRGTTTAQLLALAGRIQSTVQKEFGVRLEMEPELIQPRSVSL